MKRIRALTAMIIMMLIPCAGADEYFGQTAFLYTETVYADFEGVIDEVSVKAGASIGPEDRVLFLKTERIYADYDGTVRGLMAEEGMILYGTTFFLEPKEKYKLLASASYAYDLEENRLVHAGDTVYISCVMDATHHAIGYIGQIDNDEFIIYTTHGTLYAGEAVNVYRSPERTYQTRIGRATVYASDTEAFECEGKAVKVYVREGDRVQKGECIIEYLPGAYAPETPEIVSGLSGIVTEVFVQAGDRVSKGDKLFEYAPMHALGFSFEALQGDMADICLGSEAQAVFLIDPQETPVSASVCAIVPLAADENTLYKILCSPSMPLSVLREGLTVRLSLTDRTE
ncbi:MAG: biotin/lipoyl-binding protein [Clostridiales bacterium]|nr:biotin/lipoyl-binding protein [Clostridiales bacterium]